MASINENLEDRLLKIWAAQILQFPQFLTKKQKRAFPMKEKKTHFSKSRGGGMPASVDDTGMFKKQLPL